MIRKSAGHTKEGINNTLSKQEKKREGNSHKTVGRSVTDKVVRSRGKQILGRRGQIPNERTSPQIIRSKGVSFTRC